MDQRNECAVGCVTTNFRLQYEALGDKYAFVGVDPRGYGQSRPPARDFPDNYFERDADDVLNVMDSLGYDKVRVRQLTLSLSCIHVADSPAVVAHLRLSVCSSRSWAGALARTSVQSLRPSTPTASIASCS